MSKPATEKKLKCFFLPNVNSELEFYIIKNKEKLFKQVVDSIESAVALNKESIEVFYFKESNYFVSLKREDYLNNLQNSFIFFLSKKDPETCTRIKKLEDILLEK